MPARSESNRNVNSPNSVGRQERHRPPGGRVEAEQLPLPARRGQPGQERPRRRLRRARRTGVRISPKIQNAVGPETNSSTMPAAIMPDQRGHDHRLRARPGRRTGRRPAPPIADTTLAATPKISTSLVADAVDGDREDRAEGEDRGQSVAEQCAGAEEVHGVPVACGTARGCRGTAAVGRDEPDPWRGRAGRASRAPSNSTGIAKTANQTAANNATIRMFSPPSAVTPNQPSSPAMNPT